MISRYVTYYAACLFAGIAILSSGWFHAASTYKACISPNAFDFNSSSGVFRNYNFGPSAPNLLEKLGCGLEASVSIIWVLLGFAMLFLITRFLKR